MKKKAMSFFLALILTITLMVPFQVTAQEGIAVNVKVDSVQGNVSQLVDVKVSATVDMDISVAKLVIKYDPRLELVSFTNGAVLSNSYSQVTGTENGTFVYTADIPYAEGTSQLYAPVKAGDVFATLKFKIPAGATATDTYNVGIENSSSEFSVSKAVSDVSLVSVVGSTGTISVAVPAACQAHAFGEDIVVRTASYFSGGYSYKVCSACGHVESTVTEPTSTNVLTLVGTAIRYAGNPSGIGAHYKVNPAGIAALEEAGYKVEVGIKLIYNKNTNKFGGSSGNEKQVFYGEGAPNENVLSYGDGEIAAAIEGIGAQQKGQIYGYVLITNPTTGESVEEKVYASIKGQTNISIADVVSLMNFNKYSEASRDYLNAVMSGFGG